MMGKVIAFVIVFLVGFLVGYYYDDDIYLDY